MMENLVQAGEGWGARPPPFTLSTITYKVVVYAPAEMADTLHLFLLYPYRYSTPIGTFCVLYDGCILSLGIWFLQSITK